MRVPFTRKKSITGTSEVTGAINLGWTAVPLLGAGQRQRIEDAYRKSFSANLSWLYANSPAVRTVIDVIVFNVGQLDLRLYEELAPDQREARPEHPAALSLRYPNEVTPRDAFVRQLFKDKLIHDNAFAILTNGEKGQINLNWVPAWQMEILGSSLFVADIFRFHRPEGWSWVDIQPDAMLHWHGENPNDPRVGLSKLDTLRSIIAEDVALQAATVELANSGLQAPSWIFRPADAPPWSPQAAENFEEEMANRLRRQNKRPVVLEEGMEIRSFGVSPRDAQMFEVRKWAIERIASVYNVPLGMVGLAPDLASARQMFMSDTLPPYCKDFCTFLNQRILVRQYNWTQGVFEFDLDEKLMGDSRISTLVTASGRAVYTTDEARAKLNLPPLPKGLGKDLVTPMNVLVGENPKPSPNTMGPQNPNGPAQDGSARGTLPTQGGPPTGSPAQSPNAATAGKAQEQYPQEASLAPPAGAQSPAPVDMESSVQALLERMYDRQEKAWANRRDIGVERFTRELTSDLALLAPSLNREAAKMMSFGLNEAIAQALGRGDDPGLIFSKARTSSPAMARKFVANAGMDPLALRALGVPDEIVWERAGISPEQIERMATIQYVHDLSNGAHPEDEDDAEPPVED